MGPVKKGFCTWLKEGTKKFYGNDWKRNTTLFGYIMRHHKCIRNVWEVKILENGNRMPWEKIIVDVMQIARLSDLSRYENNHRKQRRLIAAT
ncbi:MAG: hypothetical protein ACTS7C_00420, partial [Candidatus Hodgkinia cicadicola]